MSVQNSIPSILSVAVLVDSAGHFVSFSKFILTFILLVVDDLVI